MSTLTIKRLDTVVSVDRDVTEVVVARQVVGLPGEAATVDVGETNQLPPGSAPLVTNVGDLHHAVFDFDIPMGDITPEARAAMEAAQAAELAAENARDAAMSAQTGAELAETNAGLQASGAAQSALDAQAAPHAALHADPRDDGTSREQRHGDTEGQPHP